MGNCCGKKVKRRQEVVSDFSSEDSEDSTIDSGTNGTSRRNSRKSSKRSTATTKKKKHIKQTDKGASKTNTVRPQVKLKVLSPQAKRQSAHISKVATSKQPSDIASQYYVAASTLNDPKQAILLMPKEAKGGPLQQDPSLAAGGYNYAQQYYFEQQPPVHATGMTLDQTQQWTQQCPVATTATYQKEQFMAPGQQFQQQPQWLPPPPPVYPVPPPTEAPPAPAFYAHKQVAKYAISQPMPPFPKFVEQGQQQRQSPTHVYFGEAQFAASKQPIFLPPPPKQHSPNQQGKVTYYSEQYKVLPQVQMLPPAPTQMTAEYRGVFKQVQPAVTYAVPQPASPPNWQQQKYYTCVQHQQGQSPVQVPVYPQAATHHEALLYQEAAQQNAFEPAADGTGQQMQLLAEETRVSSDEHFELLHRDIRELKQLIEAQDTKEVMAKMDRCLEMFKSISHLYRSLMRNEALQRQVGRTDTALGRTMSQMVSSYNDISSVMSSLSKDTEKLVKDAKRSPGNVANREQISRTVNPQELTTKMEGLMRLIDTLKQSYSPEIMNELMEKKKTPQ